MSRMDRLRRIEQRAKQLPETTESQSDTSHLPQSTYSEHDDPTEELASRMRQGILDSLRPFFVAEDQMSVMVFHTIKRMLQRADVVDLTNVLVSARSFIVEMEPYLNEYDDLQRKVAEAFAGSGHTDDDASSDVGHDDSGSGGTDDGAGDSDREDTVREVNPSAVSDTDVHGTIPDEGESSSDRHETTLAGATSSDGTESTETIP